MQSTERNLQPQFAIIIPACDEEECIGRVLDELSATIDSERFVIAVGVNGSSDRTAEVARSRGVVVAETVRRGYGHGCQSAIDLVVATMPSVRAYIFFAGDGASDPQDVRKLVTASEQGYAFVLGARTGQAGNWRVMRFSHVIANFVLAMWCTVLTRHWFKDLAPLRLIERELFEAIAPQEKTFGWTIEAQVGAARIGAAICEVAARERPRLAGKQKVSGVTWRRTFMIGCRILVAGFRTRLRFRGRVQVMPGRSEKQFIAQPQGGS